MQTAVVESLIDSRVSRRAFARAAIAGGALAAAQPVLGPAASAHSVDELSDEAILNFAFLVESVDTEYFTVATTGRRLTEVGIPVDGRGRQRPTVGGQAIALDGAVRILAEHLTLDEQGHVLTLRDALDVPPLGSPAGRVFSVFDRGLAPERTPQQVLAILFGNATPGTDRGGFLPDGANGDLARV